MLENVSKKLGTKRTPAASDKPAEKRTPLTSDKTGTFEAEQTEFSLLNFEQENLLQGLIFSEILGKPRSKRRAGW